ncbi:MAG: ACP S-malonyltransferase [Phycisphaerae bacterium]|nr:ACP S-malonyltransferase [Phycisphaerae bacterium]
MSQAAIFPGQGAQLVGMGADVVAVSKAAADVFAEADALLGFKLSALCFEGPEERLGATDIQQPAIFTTSVALFRAAVEKGRIRAEQFGAMGGLSLGEYTALHLAGAMSFADALKLVYRRGQLMQQAAEAQPGGMVSVLGMDEAQVITVCERARPAGRIGPANYNCPGQIVISGDQAACNAAMPIIEELGGRGTALKVAGAFHSELMRPAAEALKPVLAAAQIVPPKCRVISNVDTTWHTTPDAIRTSLYQQVYNPVRWQGCCEKMIGEGMRDFYEIGPNRVLMGLMRKISREAKVTNIGKAADLG